jgi:HD-GYP domain-containing protein (c-di-GMP phosphodiesterase class II)
VRVNQRYPYDGASGHDVPIGPVEQAIAAARDLLDLEILSASRVLDGDGDGAIAMPVESSRGTRYGNLMCISANGRTLDARDADFLRVIGRLVAAQIERESTKTGGLDALLAALEARDRYTGEHSRNVVELSVRVACELRLPERAVKEVEQVALLHDVGKMAIPDRVLLKRGPLDELEWEAVRAHPAIGARIVGSVDDLAHLAPAIRSGHERWDGSGYPDSLSGDDIPVTSRITAVCDAYDAMISERPYRAALAPESALTEVRRNAGSQFCPSAAAGLLSVLERMPELATARRRPLSGPPVP